MRESDEHDDEHEGEHGTNGAAAHRDGGSLAATRDPRAQVHPPLADDDVAHAHAGGDLTEVARSSAPPKRGDRQRDGSQKGRKPRSGDDDRKKDDEAEKGDDEKREDDKKGEGEKKSEPWSTTKKLLVFGGIAVVLILAALLAVLWWLNARHFEKTDDAFIDAHYERVAPQVAGRVIAVYVDDNTPVEPGRPLFKIDPRDYRAALDQSLAAVAQAQGNVAQQQAQREVAVANVEQAKADVENAQATLDNAASQLERYQGLSREALSPQRLDDLKTAQRNASAQLIAAKKRQASQAAQVTLAESQIIAAQAQVKSADAQVEQARLNLSYTDVLATAGGRVTNRNLQVGDYVSPGQQVLVLVPSDVYVTANFKETQLADMRPGQPVTITVDAFPDEAFRGHVESFQAGAGQVFSLLPPENATGNYVKVVQRVPVKIVFDDRGSEAYKRLGPGMSVTPAARVR